MPADMILIKGDYINMDESPMTGETEYIRKEILEDC